jgi:hypothetical protein
MCKYKEVKVGTRYVNSKGYLQVIRVRDIKKSHEKVTIVYLAPPGNKYEDCGSLFSRAEGQYRAQELLQESCANSWFSELGAKDCVN